MDIQELLSAYYVLVVKEAELLTTGRINRTYKVTAKDGSSYCLKVYSDAVLGKRIHDGLEVTNYLAPLGFPVPQVIPTKDQQELLWLDNCRYLLLKFIPGRNIPRRLVGQLECYSLGQMLGKLHQNLRNFPTADKLESTLWKGSQATLPRVFDLLKTVQAKEHQDEFDAFALNSLTYRIQALQSFDVAPEQFFHLARQAIHGDYHLDNIIFSESGQVSGVLDFDQTCYAFPSLELMRVISFTCFDQGTFNYTLAAQILRGYKQTGVNLTPADYLEMPRLWYYQLLRGLFGLSEHYTESADPRQDEAALDRHHTMVWLGNNLQAVKDFVFATTTEQ
ncbi:MAG: Homoserine kinase [Firmicutes bacterium]|nr:Homoserine kinase [Bacillota bacterium]